MVAGNYRLPFTGKYIITQGPYYQSAESGNECVYSHIQLKARNDSEALDFSTPRDTLIYASEAGEAKHLQLGSYGNVAKITHDDGRVSWYAHLQSYEGGEGRVEREAPIGRAGGSRYCDSRPCAWSPHLHFMIDAPGTTTTEWIRTLPGISWYSGSADVPCTYGEAKQKHGYYDGEAVGPALGQAASCTAPALIAPADGQLVPAKTAFSWATSDCATQGYQLRIRTSSAMEAGGTVIQDTVVFGTVSSQTFSRFWSGMDLYWSVRPANVPNAAVGAGKEGARRPSLIRQQWPDSHSRGPLPYGL